MPTAVIVLWDHPFSILSSVARGIGSGLAGIGFDVSYLNVMDQRLGVKEDVVARFFAEPQRRDCDVAIAVGAPPLSVRVGDRWLFEVLGKSFYLFSLDALIYDLSRVTGVAPFVAAATISPRLGILSPDRDACEVINDLSPRRIAHYVPYGGFFHPLRRTERINRIAVVGTMGWELADIGGGDFAGLVAANAPPAIAGHSALDGFAAEIERPGRLVSIVNLARDVLGLPAATVYSRDVTRYLAGLDAYQKRRRRTLAISALQRFPVDFFGSGWEPFAANFADARFMGTIPFHETADVCGRYSALMNFDPNWGYGLHDRVYTGVGTGCRVLTNASRALTGLTVPDPDAVLTYDANDPVLGDVADRALTLPAMDPDALPPFRMANSWLQRMDGFTAAR